MLIPCARFVGGDGVNAVERGLHGAGGDSEGLVVVGAETEGHGKRRNGDIKEFCHPWATLCRQGLHEFGAQGLNHAHDIFYFFPTDGLLRIQETLV